jgi:hypothetical protein
LLSAGDRLLPLKGSVSGYENEGKEGTMEKTNHIKAFARLRAWFDAKKITIEVYVQKVLELESRSEGRRLV